MQSSLDLVPESVVGGRYRLIESLARGGTASVWRAHDGETGTEVAVKILRDEGVDPALRERAGREAHVLEDLHHPNLVRVLDSGEDDGMPFMVMELLHGDTLSAIVDSRGALPVEEAIGLVADVADGLGLAHERGVIHRDVKPANIVCHEQVPTLVDFGIARNIDATTLTRGLVMGTASYLAPEQAQGLALTPAVDVYALGCVLYELLTGNPPFEGDNPVTVALRHVQDDPMPPADLADMPAAVNALVLRALAKNPAHRPANGADLATELRRALEGDTGDETVAIAPVSAPDGTMVMPAVAAGMATDPDADLIDPSPLPPVAPPPERPAPAIPWPLVLGAAAAALVLFLLVGALGNDPAAATRPVPDVLSSPVADATTYLEGAGLEVDVVNVQSDAPAGTVIASDPPPGAQVATDGTVELSVSAGPPPAPATTAPPEEPQGRGRDKPGKGDKDDKDD